MSNKDDSILNGLGAARNNILSISVYKTLNMTYYCRTSYNPLYIKAIFKSFILKGTTLNVVEVFYFFGGKNLNT